MMKAEKFYGMIIWKRIINGNINRTNIYIQPMTCGKFPISYNVNFDRGEWPFRTSHLRQSYNWPVRYYTCYILYLSDSIPVRYYTCLILYLSNIIPVRSYTYLILYLSDIIPVILYLSDIIPVRYYTCQILYLSDIIPVWYYTSGIVHLRLVHKKLSEISIDAFAVISVVYCTHL
jgi:hypothetical protein